MNRDLLAQKPRRPLAVLRAALSTRELMSQRSRTSSKRPSEATESPTVEPTKRKASPRRLPRRDSPLTPQRRSGNGDANGSNSVPHMGGTVKAFACLLRGAPSVDQLRSLMLQLRQLEPEQLAARALPPPPDRATDAAAGARVVSRWLGRA